MKGALCEERRSILTLADSNAVSTGSENGEAIQRLLPASSAEHRVTPAIAYAVWTYHRFALSTADIEDLLAEHGVVVSRKTERFWVNRFGSSFAGCIRRDRPKPNDKWHLDEVVIVINGVNHWLRRAVDANGDVLDILVQRRRSVDVQHHRWPRKGPIDIFIASTGLKVFGAGEWATARHGEPGAAATSPLMPANGDPCTMCRRPFGKRNLWSVRARCRVLTCVRPLMRLSHAPRARMVFADQVQINAAC